MSDLPGKMAFVTNAESVIGRACCTRLAKAGASICTGSGAGTSISGVDLAIEVDPMDQKSRDTAY